jgi:hypothetical protein
MSCWKRSLWGGGRDPPSANSKNEILSSLSTLNSPSIFATTVRQSGSLLFPRNLVTKHVKANIPLFELQSSNEEVFIEHWFWFSFIRTNEKAFFYFGLRQMNKRFAKYLKQFPVLAEL